LPALLSIDQRSFKLITIFQAEAQAKRLAACMLNRNRLNIAAARDHFKDCGKEIIGIEEVVNLLLGIERPMTVDCPHKYLGMHPCNLPVSHTGDHKFILSGKFYRFDNIGLFYPIEKGK
jgi:hypothetical protein